MFDSFSCIRPASTILASFVILAFTGCGRRAPAPADAGTSETVVVEASTAAVVDALPSRKALNVILLSIDSMRADMPWAGYERPIAPNLTALHNKSVSYARAYSTSSFTSKSVAGMLTGRYPSELARTGSFFTRYLTRSDFMCASLERDNIPCVGGHAHAYFGKGQSGFEYGFRTWQLVPGITFDYQTDPYVTSDKLTALAMDMLGNVGGQERPFFAWFHYMDPHDEYKTHTEAPHFGNRPRDKYDEEVFFTDLWIGKLLAFIESRPWAANTAIIVTADHGEAFGEHGLMRHAHELYEELIRVPLFVHIPGQASRAITLPRGHIDLAPTIRELLGQKQEEATLGTSLVPELRGGQAQERDVIADLPEDEYNERRRALIHGTSKLIAFGNDSRYALYDLEADPKEGNDLIRKQRDLGDAMRRRYAEASKQIKDLAPRGGIPKHDK